MTDHATAAGVARVLAALASTPVGNRGVLVGSSGLFGFPTRVPALTEDIDICIDEAIASGSGREIVDVLARAGFDHEPGTATFASRDGVTFDLLGHGDPSTGDHVGGLGILRVMVFGDLSRIIGDARASVPIAGGRALTAAAFVVTKLLTERGEKGMKDKLQALLVLAEHPGDEVLAFEVARLLASFDPIRRQDAYAAAQDAFISLGRDPLFADAGAEGYAPSLGEVDRGLAMLRGILEPGGV